MCSTLHIQTHAQKHEQEAKLHNYSEFGWVLAVAAAAALFGPKHLANTNEAK